jgi:UDP-N-acetylmuramyl pentapeptide synthase
MRGLVRGGHRQPRQGRLERAWRAAAFRRRALWSRLAWPILQPAAWLWRRTWLRGTPVVAVTGSFGKTSTSAAAAAALGAAFTPDRPNYGVYLAGALLRHARRRQPAVVEVGISRRGQMVGYARLLRPDVVVLTAIGGEHLLSLGTIEAVAAEKALLVRGLRAGGCLVLNGDDARCRAIGDDAAAAGARVMAVGFGDGCDWRIAAERLDWPVGTHLLLAGPGGAGCDLALRWVGHDLARCAAMGAVAALAAMAAMAALGVPGGLDAPGGLGAPAAPEAPEEEAPAAPPEAGEPPVATAAPASTPRVPTLPERAAAREEPGGILGGGPARLIAARLAGLAPLRARLEAVPLPGGAWLLCDSWKANWVTIESALGELARIGRLAGARCVAVLGDIEEPQGNQSTAYQAYGSAAARAAERILYLGNRFASFRGGVRQAGRVPAVDLQACQGVHAAARALAGELTPGTLILIKGRHSQKLARIGLLLREERVGCELRLCPAVGLRCELCPRLRQLARRV